MRKITTLLLFGALAIGYVFGQNESLLSNIEQASPSTPTIHMAGKRLVQGAWSLGGTLSAKSATSSR